MTMHRCAATVLFVLALTSHAPPSAAQTKAAKPKAAMSTPAPGSVFKKAYEAHVAGNQADAIDLFEFGLKSRPKDSNAWYFLGGAKLATGDVTGARAAYEQSRATAKNLQIVRAEDALAVVQIVSPESLKANGMTMASDGFAVLAEALRWYEPPHGRKYRMTSELRTYSTSSYNDDPSLSRCGVEFPAGIGAPKAMSKSRQVPMSPLPFPVTFTVSDSSSVTCKGSRKVETNSTKSTGLMVNRTGEIIAYSERSAMWPTITRTVAGNPFRPVVGTQYGASRTSKGSDGLSNAATSLCKFEAKLPLRSLGFENNGDAVSVRCTRQFVFSNFSTSSASVNAYVPEFGSTIPSGIDSIDDPDARTKWVPTSIVSQSGQFASLEAAFSYETSYGFTLRHESGGSSQYDMRQQITIERIR